MKKFFIFVVLAIAIGVSAKMTINFYEPQISMELAVEQMKFDSTNAQSAMRAYNTLQPWLYAIPSITVLLLFLLFYGNPISTWIKKVTTGTTPVTKSLVMFALLGSLLAMSGCQPFNTPIYFDANTNQTVFSVPQDGSEKQGKLDSIKAYEDRKVSLKRIQITRRWYQDNHDTFGLIPNGHWIPDVALFVCDRTPVARHWTSSKNTGTAQTNQGFRLQSKDGVRFTVDYDCTANILDSEAAKFMYFYPSTTETKGADGKSIESVYSTSLVPVMDSEIWTMVGIASAEFSASRNMELLKSSKAEMNTYVRDAVTAIFKDRGVNISSLGIAGDFTYIDESVQKAINEIFTSQQLLKVEQAKLDSMANQIARAENEGKGEAAKAEQEAIGESERIINEAAGQVAEIDNAAQGQADAIRALAEACKKADDNPNFIPTKELQIEAARVKRWQGQSPQIYLGGGNSTLLNLGNVVDQALKPVPAAAPAAEQK